MKILIYKEDLSSFELNGLVILMVITMTCFASFFAGVNCGTETNVTNVEVIDTFYTHLDTLQFNETNLMKVIKHYDILFPEVVLAQSKLETANYTSDIFKNGNNLFGFRTNPMRWEGLQMPVKYKGHSLFSHWTKSVEHYKRYQTANLNNDYYLKYLKSSGYAEDDRYVSLLRKMINN